MARVPAPESVYKKRFALVRKIQANIVLPTSAYSFLFSQDVAHRRAWIEITEFIRTHDLKEACLVCWHAIKWRYYNKAARDMAREAQAALTNQKNQNVKAKSQAACQAAVSSKPPKAKGKAADDTKIQHQQANAAVPDIQELSKLPKPIGQISDPERKRVLCCFFVAGTCR